MEDLNLTAAWADVIPGLRLHWGRSGHALGAVWLLLDIHGEKTFYTGDYTSFSPLAKNDDILTSELLTTTPMDLAIFDIAHGRQDYHWSFYWRNMRTLIKEKLEGGGKVILPVPLLGRAQDFLILLTRAFPEVVITVEETIYHWLRSSLQKEGYFSSKGLYRLKESICSNILVVSNNRKREQGLNQGRIFLVVAPILDSPVAAYYFRTLSQDPHNSLIFTGHVEEGTFAHKLLTNKPVNVKIGVYHCVYKIHQGMDDIRNILRYISGRRILLAHAGEAESEKVAALLKADGYSGLLNEGSHVLSRCD